MPDLSSVNTYSEIYNVFISEVVSFCSIDRRIFSLKVYAPEVASKIVPGQYVKLSPPGGEPKPYSVANWDFSSGVLEFHIERKTHSHSVNKLIFCCKNRGVICLSPPQGRVMLLDPKKGNIFISTGTAFSQIGSLIGELMLKQGLVRNTTPAINYLFWLSEKSDERYMDSFVCKLAKDFEGFEYIPVDVKSDHYNFDSILDSGLPLDQYNFYICSSFRKSGQLREKLIEKGVASNRILSDAF